MLALQIHKKKLRAIHKLLPPLRPGWALVEVRLAGICNTDVEILRGYHDFQGTPGHEFVGEVAEVKGVPAKERKRWMGRRVCGEINIACAALRLHSICKFCKQGLKSHCARREVLGIVRRDGAFAQCLALPLENLHAIPDDISDEQAVFVEPLAAACEILEQVDARKFQTAAILGDGKLAQLIARVLKTAVPRVVMYGKYYSKLEIARKAGVETKRVHGDADDLTRIKETFPLVVEATGSPTGLKLAIQMTEPRGTLVLKSTFHGKTPMETWPLVVKEITTVGSRCGPFDKAIALLHSGRADPRPLITRTFPLADAQEAIVYAQEPGVMKVLLEA